ncbi:response regulator [Massilia sp. PWRC2]|uniref:response regulator n=1 Tax=Massilia sp. PWRC2 TaxID=2804626 RepID=UPI003CE7C56E
MHQPAQKDDEPGLFLDDEDASPAQPVAHGGEQLPPWRVLIVDDDVDVHVVTKFALSTTSFAGRRLSFVHAYSAAEALAKLRDIPDIALILLDVMMETADAGLQLARQVREQLHNDLVRIVLRTGQPGQAAEHSIIIDYDINDFWSKTDLTTRKLFTTVIAALRAYATLSQAARARDAAMARQGWLEQQLATARAAAPLFAINGAGLVTDANPAAAELAGTTLAQLIGRTITAAEAPVEAGVMATIKAALALDGAWAGVIAVRLPGGTTTLRCAVRADGAGGVTGYACPLG